MGLPEIEQRFLDSNLRLLAAHYNVDAQKALIEQARLWDNPVLNTDQVIAANGRFFPYGRNPDGSYSGQYYLQVQQLIRTAGKRGKLINLATTNAKISEWELMDVLRNLRYQLRTDYYTLVQGLGNKVILEEQSAQLEKLLAGMEAQFNAGNIAQKDHLRIRALLVSLDQEKLENAQAIADIESEIKSLLQLKSDSFILPVETGYETVSPINLTAVTTLFDTARLHNPNFQLQQTQTVLQQQNLSYQKSLRTPDLTLGPNFDRNSSFAPNYFGLGISLPLPVINNNKGNIKAAALNIKQQQAIMGNAETELWNNIHTAYQKLLMGMNQHTGAQEAFYISYKKMYGNILGTYQSKQIGLLEFLDFFNDYTASQQRLLQQNINIQLSKEALNYHLGISLIK
jgi:cobalt-zinc-cadmium efflux system outer membrane protein